MSLVLSSKMQVANKKNVKQLFGATVGDRTILHKTAKQGACKEKDPPTLAHPRPYRSPKCRVVSSNLGVMGPSLCSALTSPFAFLCFRVLICEVRTQMPTNPPSQGSRDTERRCVWKCWEENKGN